MGRLVHTDGTPATKESIVKLLTAEKISCNHVRDSAGTRGNSVHGNAEAWAEGRGLRAAEKYPEDERPYHEALHAFVNEHPNLEPLNREVAVGSRNFVYAGTYDLLASEGDETGLYDWKTSKSVYDSHHLQLAAYEGARLEMGAPPTDYQAVVHLCGDGTYKLVKNRATFQEWLDCLTGYRALMALQARLKQKVAA